MTHAHFPISSFEHAILGQLRSGSSRRRYRHERSRSFFNRHRFSNHLEKIVYIPLGAAVGQHRGHALASIHRRSTPYRDNEFAHILRR